MKKKIVFAILVLMVSLFAFQGHKALEAKTVITIRLTTSQKRLIEVILTAKPYPLTSPCFGVAKTSLSLRKERDVAQRQGEVTFSPFAFFELFSM